MDNWVKEQKGNRAFDSDITNVLTQTNRTLRNTLNDEIVSLAPDAEVRNLLSRQSALLSVDDVLSNRFARESASRVGRML